VYRVAIVTVSDKGARGEREDLSGQAIKDLLQSDRWEIRETPIVSDDLEVISEVLLKLVGAGMDLILTTGGTGLGPRDNTPEATTAVIEREAPGFSEAMRMESKKASPRAILSRGVSGVRGKTLIINLPGSPKAVRECLSVILPVLDHGLATLTGKAGECGSVQEEAKE
jgi:molybdenum cofactor synthesis domain-containing protein